jgi:hypothetical protein
MNKKVVEKDHKREIENIIGKIKCPKSFKCYESGFDNICRAKDFGIESFLLCLENNPRDCKFSIPFKRSYLCHCPLRIYLSKKLKK